MSTMVLLFTIKVDRFDQKLNRNRTYSFCALQTYRSIKDYKSQFLPLLIEGFMGLFVFEGAIGGLPIFPEVALFTGDKFSDISSISSTGVTKMLAVPGLS